VNLVWIAGQYAGFLALGMLYVAYMANVHLCILGPIRTLKA
jgi:hypothetical protein